MPRLLLLASALLLTIVGLAVLLTGGFITQVAGIRVSSRSPLPALALAAAATLTWALLAARRGALAQDLCRGEEWVARRLRWIVGAIAACATAAALTFHTFSAAGADASGYLSYTALLLDGALLRPEPLAAVATWSDGPATLAPLGWRAAPDAGLQAPTYAIGLPLLMLPGHAIGGVIGASVVVALTFFVAVCATAAVARHVAGTTASVLAAVWLATSPVALVEAMQIMSDVPVTAAWMLCWWLAFTGRAGPAGVACAMAVLIRPNLAPLAIVPLAYVTWRAAAREAGRRATAAAMLAFGAPVAAAGLTVGALQSRYFGSPFRSGYGTAEEIYAWSNVVPNASLYFDWLIDTHGPWLLAAPIALVLPSLLIDARTRRELAWIFTFAAGVVGAYLVYAVFETWTYLRFLLPAMGVAAVGVAAMAGPILARLPPPARVVTLVVLVLGVASWNVSSARTHGVFRVADLHARARIVGERLAATLPVNAVIVSGEQSGAMRYYTGRSIVRWDLIDADAMPEALDRIRRNGYQVWVVLDDWEEDAFRRKFPGLAAASLDHRPTLESAPGVGIRTRAWFVRAGAISARRGAGGGDAAEVGI